MLANNYAYEKKVEGRKTMGGTLRSLLQLWFFLKCNFLGFAHIRGKSKNTSKKNPYVSNLCNRVYWFFLAHVNRPSFPNLESGKRYQSCLKELECTACLYIRVRWLKAPDDQQWGTDNISQKAIKVWKIPLAFALKIKNSFFVCP
jgi:hypothetical protein